MDYETPRKITAWFGFTIFQLSAVVFKEEAMHIDIRTLVMIVGLTHLIQVIVFIHQYKINKTYQGFGWWLLWSAAEMIGFFCMLLRGIPSLFSIIVILQNSLLVLGTLFLYVGVLRFLDKKENLKLLLTLFAIYFASLVFFVYVDDDIIIRSVIINGALLVTSILTARNLLVYKNRSIAASANFNSVIFLIHGLVFIFRAVMIVAGYPINDFFNPSIFNVITFLDALIVGLLWTFGLIIMLNQRLNAEMAEAKEHFEEIFSTSPDGVLITSLTDGIIIDVNAGFTELTGYTRDESIGKSSIGIKLWKNPDDRQRITGVLREKGFCTNFESVF